MPVVPIKPTKKPHRDDAARAHATRMAKHMKGAFVLGVVSAVLVVLFSGLGFRPGIVVMCPLALGVNLFAAYAINRARLVTTAFPVTHLSRTGRSRGDVTAGILAALAAFSTWFWIDRIIE